MPWLTPEHSNDSSPREQALHASLPEIHQFLFISSGAKPSVTTACVHERPSVCTLRSLHSCLQPLPPVQANLLCLHPKISATTPTFFPQDSFSVCPGTLSQWRKLPKITLHGTESPTLACCAVFQTSRCSIKQISLIHLFYIRIYNVPQMGFCLLLCHEYPEHYLAHGGYSINTWRIKES